MSGDAPAAGHVLASTDRGGPGLLLRGPDGALRNVALDGAFAWRVSNVRRCVGRLEDGEHAPCPTDEPVGLHRQCRACSGMEEMDCVFEPRCEADPASCACLTTFRAVPHVVYIGFHGTLPKVGLTMEWRVAHRLREQGADAWMVVARHPGRGEARADEKRLSALFGVPEHRSHRETLPQLARPVPWDAIETRAAELRRRLAGAYEAEPVLHRITDHAITQPLTSVPRRVASAGTHRGTWLGAKGNSLVYQEVPRLDRLRIDLSRPLVALKRGDLVGRRIESLD